MAFQKEILEQFEAEIRAGRGQHVHHQLPKINTAAVPRELRLRLANICRRVGHHSIGLKLLAPVVYPEKHSHGEAANSREIAEYAVLLIRSGVIKEAKSMLAKVHEQEAPEALLFRAFAHFERWEFEPTLALLEKYVAIAPGAYARLVGRVNLAYAYVGSGRVEPAVRTLAENIRECVEGGYGVLHANSYELLTRLHAQNGDVDAAGAALEKAKAIMGSGQAAEHRLIRKWTHLLEAMRAKDLTSLRAYRATLNARTQSEYFRELDRFGLRIVHDEATFDRLIFGTPFHEYREMIFRELGRRPQRDELLWGRADAPVLDVMSGEIDGREALPAGSKPHAVIEILLRDFYQGLPLGELFGELYPDERFDIFSSPNRVRQILHRTRKWLEDQDLPMDIQHENGRYYLETSRPLAFRVPLERKPVEGYHQYLQRLRDLYLPGQFIRVQEASAALKIARATFFRFSNWAVDSGQLERIGSHKTSRYKLVS